MLNPLYTYQTYNHIMTDEVLRTIANDNASLADQMSRARSLVNGGRLGNGEPLGILDMHILTGYLRFTNRFFTAFKNFEREHLLLLENLERVRNASKRKTDQPE
tara:strand:+ start:3683 stop:3994 length:312 start_codon:yes stop_codon:yes gene_type:complete